VLEVVIKIRICGTITSDNYTPHGGKMASEKLHVIV
jgi:hypothetical protein